MPFRPKTKAKSYRARIVVKGPQEDPAKWKSFRKALRTALKRIGGGRIKEFKP